MARTAKATTEDISVEISVDKMDEKDKKITKKTVNEEPLVNDDEIEVVSLIPNVSYKDSKTLDIYEWDIAGHVEVMTFETLQNMWRNYKGYFRNLCLKPNDDRVIKKFGLTKIFEQYEFLMDKDNYTKDNVKVICDTISEIPMATRFSVFSKIKSLVAEEEISNVFVIKELEKKLRIDLI